MEKDIELIIDVEPNEAEALIGLLEMLFDEWYIARNERRERLAKVTGIATEKRALQKGQPSTGTAESDN